MHELVVMQKYGWYVALD